MKPSSWIWRAIDLVGGAAGIGLTVVFVAWFGPRAKAPRYSTWSGSPRIWLEDRDAATAALVLLPIFLVCAVVSHLRNPSGSRMVLSLMWEAIFGRRARR